MEHHIGGLNEILGALLHGQSTEEGYHLLLVGVVGAGNGVILIVERINGIVHREHLARILMILVDDRVACQVRHTHDAIGMVHAVLLDGVDGGVHMAAATVVVGGVHVDTQRLAAHLLGVDACGIGEPVVGVDDVELLATRHHTGNDRIIVDFLVQIARVTACKLHATQVVDMHKVEVGIDMVAVSVIIVGIHEVAHPTAYVVEVDIAVSDGHTVHRNDARVGAVLVAPWLRQAERYVDVALCVKTLRYTKIGCG